MNRNLWLGMAAAAALAACSGSKGNLSVSTKSASTTQPPASTSLDAGNGMTIDRVRIVVRKIEVEGGAACTTPTPPTTPTSTPTTPSTPMTPSTGGATTQDQQGGGGMGGSGDGENEDCELEFGPFLVDLSGTDLTAGGVHPAFDVSVPPGTYQELKFKLGTITAAQAAAAPVAAQQAGLADMVGLNASVAVNGTTDGTTPFTFTTPISISQKREGAITVDPTTGAAITLDFDPSKWFQNADGSKLDPNSATDLGAILANIRASFRVLHDENHDGEDDEHVGSTSDDGSTDDSGSSTGGTGGMGGTGGTGSGLTAAR